MASTHPRANSSGVPTAAATDNTSSAINLHSRLARYLRRDGGHLPGETTGIRRKCWMRCSLCPLSWVLQLRPTTLLRAGLLRPLPCQTTSAELRKLPQQVLRWLQKVPVALDRFGPADILDFVGIAPSAARELELSAPSPYVYVPGPEPTDVFDDKGRLGSRTLRLPSCDLDRSAPWSSVCDPGRRVLRKSVPGRPGACFRNNSVLSKPCQFHPFLPLRQQ